MNAAEVIYVVMSMAVGFSKIYKTAAVYKMCNIVVIMMNGTALLSNSVSCVCDYECLWCDVMLNMYFCVNRMKNMGLIE
jgi:hypothetical protein